MKVVQPEELEAFLTKVFVAAGTPPDIAEFVSGSLVDSNLKGLDSHGAVRVAFYLDDIASGWINPASRPEIVRETPTMAILNANQGFGIYALGYAVDLAIAKARECQVAVVGVTHSTHTGRLGWYAERAAAKKAAVMIVGGGALGHPQHATVAPYGGRKRLIATNPYVFGFPGGQFEALTVDISSSTVAEGKLKVHRANHTELPAGWILDKNGRPSTNVEDFYDGGMLLPAAGHKGFGLGLAAEFLAGLMLGKAHELNWLVLALDIAAFCPLDEFVPAAERVLRTVKEIPPAPGFTEVMYPGEPEARVAKQKATEGIALTNEIWAKICGAAGKVGVMPPEP